jgi:hypothetical protein
VVFEKWTMPRIGMIGEGKNPEIRTREIVNGRLTSVDTDLKSFQGD